jgi:hypothetical protein
MLHANGGATPEFAVMRSGDAAPGAPVIPVP